MKKILAFLLLFCASSALAQTQPVRGRDGNGVDRVIKVTPQGRLEVEVTAGGAGGGGGGTAATVVASDQSLTLGTSQPLTVTAGGKLRVDTGTPSLPTGASTSALQTTANTSLGNIDTKLGGTLTVSGPLTDSQLRATAVPVSVSGVATAANQGTANTTLGNIDTKLGGTLAVSGPVTDAQLRASAVPVSVSGVATAANQSTGNTSLANIDTKTPALGSATSANSSPVVIASDQGEVGVGIPDRNSSGTITTQNLVPAGTATAGSAVELSLNGRSGLSIQVTGTYTGALSLQGTVDGSTWVTLGGVPLLNVNTGALSATITSATQGIFQAEGTGFQKVRLTGLAAVTGTATVTLRASNNPSTIALDAALPTGTNTLGAVNIAASQTLATVTTVGTITTGNVQPINQTGLFVNSAASTNATSVKASAGQLLTLTLSNNGGSVAFVKFYNKASAPTVGTDTPVMVIPVPASGNISYPFGFSGQQFATGIAFAITNLIADSDTTAVTAGQVKVALTYK